MKKLSLFLFLIFGFTLTALGGMFGGVSYADVPREIAEIERNEINIDTPETFVNLLNNWEDSGDQTAIYQLNCDVNFSTSAAGGVRISQPTSPLGTYKKPFMGIFNGKGHTITGLNIDATTFAETAEENTDYAGLFGVAENATINNLKLAGAMSLKTASRYISYMGAVVGLGKNVALKNVSVDVANINYNTTFDKNLNFGILAGELQSSTVNNVICRTSSSNLPLGQWNFSSKNNKEISFGGIAGRISSTKVSFALVQTTINMTKTDEFNGILSVGGVAGETTGGTTQIVNVGMSNTISSLSGENIKVGEVVGVIGNPTPNQNSVTKNISYVHYRDNTGVDVFGDKGEYRYDTTAENNCNITLSGREITTSEYFTELLWEEAWDFEKVWYVSGRLENQAFLNDLQVGLSDNFNKQVFELRNVRINGGQNVSGNDIGTIDFRYGDKVELDIGFKTEEYSDGLGNTTYKKLIDYYMMRELHLNSNRAVTSSTYRAGIEMSDTNIRIVGDGRDDYEISPHISNGQIDYFTLTVDELNMYTSGRYNITMDVRSFKANITSKLFNEDTEIGGEPGYVYNTAIGTSSQRTSWTTDISYSAERPPQVTTEPSKAFYYFQGWYIKAEGGDQKISDSQTLTIEVGKPYEIDGRINYISGDVDIYAKYNEDSRQIYFSIDNSSRSSGVDRIVLYDGNFVNTLYYQDYLEGTSDADKSIYIRKETKTIQIEIYINRDYTLDADYFAERHTVQGGVTCNLIETAEVQGLKMYKFEFTDLDKNSQSTENSIPVLINTKPVDDGNGGLIWIIVGCVAGVLLIALAVLLFILIRRRRGGGGKFKTGKTAKPTTYKTKKKDYKNMYF